VPLRFSKLQFVTTLLRRGPLVRIQPRSPYIASKPSFKRSFAFGSGFRQQASASLTPAYRLKFESKGREDSPPFATPCKGRGIRAERDVKDSATKMIWSVSITGPSIYWSMAFSDALVAETSWTSCLCGVLKC
jgi:hypothetical protein